MTGISQSILHCLGLSHFFIFSTTLGLRKSLMSLNAERRSRDRTAGEEGRGRGRRPPRLGASVTEGPALAKPACCVSARAKLPAGKLYQLRI